jgi:hypothetical protein
MVRPKPTGFVKGRVHMRKSVLIAAMVLASAAAAQAGEVRSLSQVNANDPPATVQPRPTDVRVDNVTNTTAETPRYAPPPGETPQPADTSRNAADAPRYSARPAPVQATPPATTVTPPSSEPTYHRSPRYRQAQMYRQALMHRRPHYPGRITTRRIIAALHRYGIYW